jgi:hypothetical protein
MNNARRILGLVLLATSVLDLSIALIMLSPVERPLVLLPGLIGIAAGNMAFRGFKYWALPAALASLVYLSYGAHITAKRLLRGEWADAVSSFSLPLQDPSIPIFAKITFMWFQAVLPLFLVALLAVCVVTWLRRLQTRPLGGTE